MKKRLGLVMVFVLIGLQIPLVTPAKAAAHYDPCLYCHILGAYLDAFSTNNMEHTIVYNDTLHDFSIQHPLWSESLPHEKSIKKSETLATCTADGLIVWHCSVCDTDFTETTSALGHSFITYISDKNATCILDGTKTAVCERCTQISTIKDTGSATGHTWGPLTHDPATVGAASRHVSVCGNDSSHKEMAACVFTGVVTDPTCTSDGFTTHTCAGCGYSYKDSPVKALPHTLVVDKTTTATCIQTGLTQGSHCSVCQAVISLQQVIPALGHIPGEWEVTQAPTNKGEGRQIRRCTRCGVILETAKIPLLSETWPNNTACSYGLRFRDTAPELTDKWYMYTPVDLTKKGVLDIPLIASNRYRIGTAQVTVKQDRVSATYKVTADKVEVKQEFMTFLQGLDGLETVEPEAMKGRNIPLGTPVDIASLGGSQALFFMRLVVTYDIYAKGVQWWPIP